LKSQLLDFIQRHNRLLLLTGAGVSTASGIPDYRDEKGDWKHSKPIYFQDFVSSLYARQRYWARSAAGWQRFSGASPSKTHHALAELEEAGKVSTLITQNVDRLHQRAGSREVIDLHGTLAQVVCLDCSICAPREAIQHALFQQNLELMNVSATIAPDGDVQLEDLDFNNIQIPSCEYCGGVLKPDVVFYGENVPSERVKQCFSALEQSDAMLVVGSSLMVYSGLRFVRRAHESGLPIVAINRGVTRADDLLNLKIEQDCNEVLSEVLGLLAQFENMA
jgi:NAD-dependent SIR2 family protein deacetylase